MITMSRRLAGKKASLLLLLFFLTGNLFALDLTVMGGAGNFSFDTASKNPIGKGVFKGDYYPLGLISVEGEITETFGYTIRFERDPLLRNVFSPEINIAADFIKFSAGPLFSLFASTEVPVKPGISAELDMEFPGILFLNFRGGTTFGTTDKKGDSTLVTSRIALGFWLPNLVNTFSVSRSVFNLAMSDTIHTKDELLRFCYQANLYEKNAPYTVFLDMGFQVLRRDYGDLGEDIIRSLFVGFETIITVKTNFDIRFGAEIPIVSWGKDPLETANMLWLSKAFAGFTWTIEK